MITKVTPVSDLPAMYPNTMAGNHCTFEDWFRYIGVGASFVASGWCFMNDSKVPGAMALISGAIIIVLHITDKTCGSKAKIIKAATERFQGFVKALQQADQTAETLRDANKQWTEQDAQAKAELGSLLQAKTDLEQGKHTFAADVGRMQAENQNLREFSTALQKQFTAKSDLLLSLQKEVDQYIAENVQFHNLLAKATGLIPQFAQTEKQIEGHLGTTTGGLQQTVNQFTTQLHQMEAVVAAIEQMNTTIALLQAQIEAFKVAAGDLKTNVQDLEAAQQKELTLQRDFSALEKRLGADRAALEETGRKLEKEFELVGTTEDTE